MSKQPNTMRSEPLQSKIEVHETSSVVPITAGKERIKSILSSLPHHARVPSWRIAMDFDEVGDLTCYWEGSCDEDGNELTGGGIERIEEGPARGEWRAYRFLPEQPCLNPANVAEYIASAVQGFVSDPPDTDSQWGYLSALLVIAKEAFGQRMDMPRSGKRMSSARTTNSSATP